MNYTEHTAYTKPQIRYKIYTQTEHTNIQEDTNTKITQHHVHGSSTVVGVPHRYIHIKGELIYDTHNVTCIHVYTSCIQLVYIVYTNCTQIVYTIDVFIM